VTLELENRHTVFIRNKRNDIFEDIFLQNKHKTSGMRLRDWEDIMYWNRAKQE